MCSVQVPKGCIFVYDDGSIPGSENTWAGMTEKEYDEWHQKLRRRPGK